MTTGFRLSPQQERLWTFQRAGEDTPFRAVGRVSIRGVVDPERLDRAVEAVAQKYEILRTTLVAGPDGPRQVVVDDARPALSELDLADAGSADQEARIAALTTELCGASPGSGHGPAPGLSVVRIRRAPDRHDLLIAAPALCADGQSLQNLVREVAQAYATPEQTGEALQYADLAEWMIELLEAEESRPGREHWRGRDLRAGAAARIPFQAPAPGGFAPASQRRTLAPDVAARVARAAADRGVDVRTFVLAAWVTLLRRLSGETDVLVGVGAAGRRFEELAEPLGLFERYLPLSVRVEDDSSFAAVLERVALETRTCERWQDCFAWPGVDPTERPPYCSFAFHGRRRAPAVQAGELELSLLEELVCCDRFECRLTCVEAEDALLLELDYDQSAFGAATIERLGDQLESCLASAAERPTDEIGALDVLGAAERQDRIVDFNATATDYPKDVCAHHWFEEHARRTPDAVAVRQADRALTYAELDRRANQLAHHLQARGVGPDVLVALLIERSVEMVVGILAILKAGGAYVPVDPAYPEERLRFLLEDTDAPVLVTQARLAGQLTDTGAQIVCVDSDAAEIETHPTEAPASRVRPANLVYVIYTSGSTGKPKGVVITHEKLVISNSARVAWFGHTPGTFLLMSSVAFDSSVVGIFWTLCGGGTLLLIPEGLEGDLSQIPAVVADGGVTHLLTLPSVYRLILDSARPEELAGLQTVIVAGEACPLKMVDRHRAMLPQVGLFSEYGATETTVFSSVYDCLQQTLPIAPVGSPIDDAQMYVLDARLGPCPVGVPGEVHFGGTALALGYWRRPGLTAERFVPNPFVEEAGARLYKSGDLARHLECGDVEFLGRIDNQVKIRGFRIELEEIEVALLKHPELKEVAVLALASESGDKRLVAYAVPEGPAGSSPPSVGALREFLLESLPDFMVPGIFVFLEDFPRTPNGKVDRKALPEPGSERPELAGAYEAPGTEIEAALAAIWADVLRLERVGIRDNFFELGGDSILSIQVVSRAKRAGLALTPRQLFENQTVAELAAAAQVTGPVAVTGAEEQGPVVGPVPLTPVQHWFFGLELPEPGHWTMPLLLDVRRRVEQPALEQALHALAAHHDALRLRFARTDAGWSQEIAPVEATAAGELVRVEDLSGVPVPERPAELARRASVHHASLDLAQGPMMRAVLFEHGDGHPQELLWIVHHLAADGVSYRILLEDLERALTDVERGAPVDLPPKTTSFRRWSERLSEYAATPAARSEVPTWAALAAEPVPALPLDHAGGVNDEASARKVVVSLSADETRALLTEVPKTYNTQINDVLLTALVEAAASWTGESSLYLDLEGHGREEELLEGVDVSRTVGWFTTDFPVRLHATAPFEPGAALRSVKEELRRIPGRGFGFGVARFLGPDAAALDAVPRPALAFNYLGQFDQVLGEEARFRLSAAESGESHAPAGQRLFALEAYGMVSAGRLEMVFEYSANLHERSTIESLAAEFVRVLRALIEHCLSPEAGGFTASDFSDFAWDESELADIVSAIEESTGSEREDAGPAAPPRPGSPEERAGA